MTRIHVDIDDTIADTTSTFLQYIEHKYKIKINKDKLTLHEYNKIIGEITKKEKDYFREFEKSNFHSKIIPVKNSQKVIVNLAKNHDLVLISGRDLSRLEGTKKWISEFFPNCFLEMHLVNQYPRTGEEKGPKKTELCKKLNCSLSIEDDADTALSLTDLGIKVLLFTQPWNLKTNLNGSIKRFNNWQEVNLLLNK
ncbi:MAG: hypothetical protein AABW58_01010 [Nanoarchaeota archaeon]